MAERVRGYDPFSAIPRAETLRRRLAELQEQARRLKILLRTAELIEREQSDADAAEAGKGVAHDAQ